MWVYQLVHLTINIISFNSLVFAVPKTQVQLRADVNGAFLLSAAIVPRLMSVVNLSLQGAPSLTQYYVLFYY